MVQSCYVCRRDGTYVSTLVPYGRNQYLLERVLVGYGQDFVCYIFPDEKYFAVTTKRKEELQTDEQEITLASGTTESEYLSRTLQNHQLGSYEHLKCLVNLFYDFTGEGEEPITLHLMVEM